MSVRLNLPPIALMIEIEVVHPAGHPQQHFTHHRDVGEMVGVDRHLRVDTIRQRINFGIGVELDGRQHAIAARRHGQRL